MSEQREVHEHGVCSFIVACVGVVGFALLVDRRGAMGLLLIEVLLVHIPLFQSGESPYRLIGGIGGGISQKNRASARLVEGLSYFFAVLTASAYEEGGAGEE